MKIELFTRKSYQIVKYSSSKIFFILVIFGVFYGNICAQTPDATADFQIPDIPISTTPQYPAFCDANIGILVECNQDYLSYRWKRLNLPQTQLSGKTVTIKQAGEWDLTVEYNFEGRLCAKVYRFNVKDLSNPDEIAKYFKDAGFYEINIFRDLSQVPDNNICILERSSFKSTLPKIDLNPSIDMVLSSFKPIKDLGGTKVISNNGCLCSEGISTLESQFNEGQAKLWVHQWFINGAATQGKLFVKGSMPSESELPISAQKAHLTSIHPNILSQNTSTGEQARVIFSNIFMPHPIGGYEPSGMCPLPIDLPPNTHFLTPRIYLYYYLMMYQTHSLLLRILMYQLQKVL